MRTFSNNYELQVAISFNGLLHFAANSRGAAIAHCLTKSCPIVERRGCVSVSMSWKGKVTEEGSLNSTGGRLELEFAGFSAILVTNYANSTNSISSQRRDLKFGVLDSERARLQSQRMNF